MCFPLKIMQQSKKEWLLSTACNSRYIRHANGANPILKQFLQAYKQAINDLTTAMAKLPPNVQMVGQILNTSQFIKHLVGQGGQRVATAMNYKETI